MLMLLFNYDSNCGSGAMHVLGPLFGGFTLT